MRPIAPSRRPLSDAVLNGANDGKITIIMETLPTATHYLFGDRHQNGDSVLHDRDGPKT